MKRDAQSPLVFVPESKTRSTLKVFFTDFSLTLKRVKKRYRQNFFLPFLFEPYLSLSLLYGSVYFYFNILVYNIKKKRKPGF